MLLSIQCLRMAYSDYVKERILFYHHSKNGRHMAMKVDVVKFLRCYREIGTIAQAPGTGQASKLTPEIHRVIEEQMKKNDEVTGLELQKLLLKEIKSFDASLSSILRWTKDLGWTANGTKYCQMIRDVNKEKRLK